MPHAAANTASADLDRKVSDLYDRILIVDLITHIGVILDEGRFDNLRSVFTEDVVVRFGFPGVEPIDTVAALMACRHRPQRAYHLFTDHLIELSGDRAQARASLTGVHVRRDEAPGAQFDIGAHYRFEMVRTTDGWRISRMTTEAAGTAGVAS
ncbi:MAG: nuclear transport factor 2 family protein [Parvibaculaceae bacterium]